jgi:hypothetical protein
MEDVLHYVNFWRKCNKRLAQDAFVLTLKGCGFCANFCIIYKLVQPCARYDNLAINDKNYLALSIIEQCCVAKKLCAKYA